MSIANLRKDYTQGELSESSVDSDPIRQFRLWFDQALTSQLLEPNAMTLATALPSGEVSARIVLLKGFDERGFVFFSNYLSRKAHEIDENPHAALLFFWAELERQVRIEGTTERVDAADSDTYFASRPLGSRLGAIASPQSQVIPSRTPLEEKMAELQRQYADGNVPRPPHWGGTRVIPTQIEFWQGRPSRLHDRIRYRKCPTTHAWIIERLAP
ncbi:pyridoxamine 5 -phosphate oxidase : Pyridoxal 5'-phosphate synthase OS=Roseiflexus castenholzii (strain DSM 13941 / HLO8) GN=Rcas_1067 PE=3 SV=1: Pyridox_oxidase: PNPOx_C [Tuwongella immobilis]|uniref:Pyridoxine/pyridoxamine 5'-phosphate oxidase n=2 Tax=Tuwongella immobilis TaxID=692036 RepID=A0A6C2YUU3_9BACT|nr:pyridoxamine 5'-phosphate oxidase [Tuwongella immobilis]VIP04642.1 pyridoxamine 5 -phosphate oxidase : Pyridoxal 5'-phosphate synthase OS=Roseiflexus castenholzii (strain DSM 13941 / HLO8) GN=Rcas_1067 PE=3 SV=1: Pyridox_oxidase: PNPOx_C [Tuwongella immobilis]VTS06645.1 pyridoxamine 5 -phosphate oxidase : Pyridoxal 5'-phosphate synthase OS=Roseiflexus castenholzii (strain DSM 13941 / HLO8) GN=Rcas_1067 PE=3 SV=1: Pyridox_oxidase: PNPOx_C [Tuwongella immobilis]